MTTSGGPDRPNFFIRLELDPRAAWSEATFQKALAAKKSAWGRIAISGLQDSPRTAEAKGNLRLVEEIMRVMGEPASREKERKDALRLEDAERVARSQELRREVELRLARGHLWVAEVAALEQRFAKVLAEDPSTVTWLRKLPVRSPESDAPATLSADHEIQLTSLLRTLAATSIYEVLKDADKSVTDTSPVTDLSRAADRLFAQMHQRADKSDPRVKASERLAGLAKVLFASVEQRKLHDDWQRQAVLRELANQLLATLSDTKVIEAGHVQWYLEEARRRGADPEEAQKFLRRRIPTQGWSLQLPPDEVQSAVQRMVVCPRCADLNDPVRDACDTCGLQLRLPCPRCRKIAPSYGGGCECGFPIGQRSQVLELMARAEREAETGEPARAEAMLAQAKMTWPAPDDATDEVSERIRRCEDKLGAVRRATEQLRIATESLRRDIDALMGKRFFVLAARRLRGAPEGLSGRVEKLRRAQDAIARARALYERAMQPSTPLSKRAQLYEAALEECDDLEEARAELARIPPAPPVNVRATLDDPAAGVLLTWEAPPDPKVTYVVVRREAATAPETAENLPGQTCVAEVQASPHRDKIVAELLGRPLTYAVFSARSGTFSTPAAARPLLPAVDPDLGVRAGDAQVRLSWKLPPHASRIEVTRREDVAGARVEILRTGHGTAYVDEGLRNGVRYEYIARAGFPGLPGGLNWSKGVTRLVTPREPPKPPGPLTLSLSQGLAIARYMVELRFPPADQGELRIYHEEGKAAVVEGDHGPMSALPLHGEYLAEGSPARDALYRDETFLTYVPVLVIDEVGYVGRPRRLALVEEVSDLHGHFVNGTLRLSWTWPAVTREVLVGHDPQAKVIDPTAQPGSLFVRRKGDSPVGSCEIHLRPVDVGMLVTVSVVTTSDGTDFVTAGVSRYFSRPR